MQNKVTDSGAESPTTAQPFDMSDDDVQETGIIGDGTVSPMLGSRQNSEGPSPPPKPPRPMSEAQKNQIILKEAFPTVEDGVIRAVLSASGGRVEPAFNALLGALLRCCAVARNRDIRIFYGSACLLCK